MEQRFGSKLVIAWPLALLIVISPWTLRARQEVAGTTSGTAHEDHILGVHLGMDVPTALQTVFVNAHRKPGQEKPDILRHEGKDKNDIRVLYKDLEIGDLQILFAGGKWVKEILLTYKSRPLFSDLRLAPNGSTGNAMGGERYDDRYIVGFTNEVAAKRRRIWYRDEKISSGYRQRIQFVSDVNPDNGQVNGQQIVSKMILVTPGDEEKFTKAMAGQ
jgi:hypothetical protein